jgi:hypothetical protein
VWRSEGSEHARQKKCKSQVSECHKGRFGQKYLASGIHIKKIIKDFAPSVIAKPAEARRQTSPGRNCNRMKRQLKDWRCTI